MIFDGIAKLDKKTKNLVKRLNSENIAIIDQADVDRVCAESLLDTKVKVVINTSHFSTGRYPNTGPMLLYSAGLHLIEDAGQPVFDLIKEGDRIMINGDTIYKDGKVIAKGTLLTQADIEQKMALAREGLSKELDDFAANTLAYVQKEKGFILEDPSVPQLKTEINGKQVLIIVRGYEYKQDLQMLRSYIRNEHPVIIGVDGGADALLEEGVYPDIILGDMDSATDKALKSANELIVHAYRDGNAPGLKRVQKLGLKAQIFDIGGTSEDAAMLLAYELGAELIVLVGSHVNLIEFLDKGRKGMASTFLVRLKVGDRLVDAKGVNKLYKGTPQLSYLAMIFAAAFVVIIVIGFSSPQIRAYTSLFLSRLRLMLR